MLSSRPQGFWVLPRGPPFCPVRKVVNSLGIGKNREQCTRHRAKYLRSIRAKGQLCRPGHAVGSSPCTTWSFGHHLEKP